jgi:hypothetical protein
MSRAFGQKPDPFSFDPEKNRPIENRGAPQKKIHSPCKNPSFEGLTFTLKKVN